MSEYDAPPPDDEYPTTDNSLLDEPEFPHDLIAEQSVLGAMMLNRDAVDDVIDVMRPADLYLPKHEIIALAIGRMANVGKPIDVLTVTDELEAQGELTRAGGAVYLHQLTGIPSTSANAGYYAERVARLAVRRRLLDAATRLREMGQAREGDVDDILEQARAVVDEAASGRRRAVRAVHETLDDLIEDLDNEPRFYRTPWHSLDEQIGGFEPGALYVIGARPGSGKTNALLQCAAALATIGPVAFSSLEMKEVALQQRLLAQYGDVNIGSIRAHRIARSDWDGIKRAKDRLQGAPIFIDERPDSTIADIRAHARSVSRRGKLLAGVCVDYLQLVKSAEAAGRRSRTEVVDQLAQDLHALAIDLDVPVIAAAQLKRAPQQRGRKRVLPTLEDLREAGGIEQAADAVLLLDRDPDNKRSEIDVVLAKNRQGQQGRFRLRWRGAVARLDDVPWTPYLDEPEEEPRP